MEWDKRRERKSMRNSLNYRPDSYVSSGLDGLNFKKMSTQWFLILAVHQNYLGSSYRC